MSVTFKDLRQRKPNENDIHDMLQKLEDNELTEFKPETLKENIQKKG